MCSDISERNLILANTIRNSDDAVPETNIQHYYDYN